MSARAIVLLAAVVLIAATVEATDRAHRRHRLAHRHRHHGQAPATPTFSVLFASARAGVSRFPDPTKNAIKSFCATPDTVKLDLAGAEIAQGLKVWAGSIDSAFPLAVASAVRGAKAASDARLLNPYTASAIAGKLALSVATIADGSSKCITPEMQSAVEANACTMLDEIKKQVTAFCGSAKAAPAVLDKFAIFLADEVSNIVHKEFKAACESEKACSIGHEPQVPLCEFCQFLANQKDRKCPDNNLKCNYALEHLNFSAPELANWWTKGCPVGPGMVRPCPVSVICGNLLPGKKMCPPSGPITPSSSPSATAS